MILDRLDRRGLRALEAAVRGGDPVRLARGVGSAVPLDEIVPLCHDVEDDALRRWLPPPALPGSGIAVTALIPASRGVPLGLRALAGQDVEVDVVVLANGDYSGGTAGVETRRVTWEGHGRTRQAGLRWARHPYVLYTVDDAIPLGAGFVRTLVEALEAGGFDAVYARQVPWPTADRVTRERLRAWTPPEGAGAGQLDHVCALHRRELLERDPLPDVPIAEDHVWGRRHRIGYVAAAPVLHSHPRTLRALYRRTRDLHEVLTRDGAEPGIPDLATLARVLPGTVGRDVRGALGEALGQYVGARRGR